MNENNIKVHSIYSMHLGDRFYHAEVMICDLPPKRSWIKSRLREALGYIDFYEPNCRIVKLYTITNNIVLEDAVWYYSDNGQRSYKITDFIWDYYRYNAVQKDFNIVKKVLICTETSEN